MKTLIATLIVLSASTCFADEYDFRCEAGLTESKYARLNTRMIKNKDECICFGASVVEKNLGLAEGYAYSPKQVVVVKFHRPSGWTYSRKLIVEDLIKKGQELKTDGRCE